jgi:hypothetical protein
MPRLFAEIAAFALIAWLGLLARVIALRMLRGDMPLTGLLSSSAEGGIDPERVQSVLVVGFAVLLYLTEFVRLPAGAAMLPEVPQSLLVLLAGSNGVYLSGKIARTGAFRTTPPTEPR